jgi:F-type H+-transporting ATPase subunit delta
VFAAEVSKNETVQELLKGSINAETLSEVFIKVCDDQLDQYGQNLVKVMAENGRLIALPEVVTYYTQLKADYEQSILVDVSSAVELSAKQQTTLVASLEKRLAKKVKLNCKIDTNVVGGLLIKADDLVIDSTVRGKLDRLANALQS